jgi:hypothetical protein
VVAVAYPFYFNWWDHKNCRDGGGTWNEAQGKCMEPRNARFDSSGSATYEDDHSSGDQAPAEKAPN